MASSIVAGIAGDVLGSVVGGLVGAGANAINQSVEFGYNQALQSNAFQHDKDMLALQVAATRQLQSDLINLREQVLRKGGFSDTDAARGAIGAPMSRLVDWNGTRLSAPGSIHTTSYSGRFVGTTRQQPHFTPSPQTNHVRVDDEVSSVSSLPTTVTSVPSSRTADWVHSQRQLPSWGSSVSQHSQLEPFHPNALRVAWGSTPSSSSRASTVDGSVIDSWTPAFNLKHQPLFARFHPRGASNV